MNSIKVLFICLGNICRSPTAHGIFEAKVASRNLQDRIVVDSAATGDWQIGKSPDPRAQAAAKDHGYDFSHLVARQIELQDFFAHDYIFAMDKQNLIDLEALKPESFKGELCLFLEKAYGKQDEVPDPYYGEKEDFDMAVKLIEAACDVVLDKLVAENQL